MSTNSDQLAILGQKVIDTLIATYNPTNDPSMALALHPGQALADEIVQNGVTNPLRLSEWLEDQYDYPLWLKRSDASSISASSVGSLSAKSAYLAMIPWATPSVAADSPEYARIAALIARARKDLGDNPDALPFGCEPTDFALPESTAWHVFDQKITTSDSTTTTTTPVKANPQLWKMRALTENVVSELTPIHEQARKRRAFAAEIAVEPRAEAIRKLRTMPDPAGYAVQPVEFMTISPSPITSPAVAPSHFKTARLSNLSVAAAITALDAPRSQPTVARQAVQRMALNRRYLLESEQPAVVLAGQQVAPVKTLDKKLLSRLATLQLHDLVQAPAVTEVTTSASELHVHFEYCLLTITRRLSGVRWWRPDLILADDWYVPGMRRGDMIKPSADEAYAHCLPQGLLLVRNVEFSGSWTAEARRTMENAVSFLGPFLMRAPETTSTEASAVEQISVLGAGVQVIGELCSPLPPLPPVDDPTLLQTPPVA